MNTGESHELLNADAKKAIPAEPRIRIRSLGIIPIVAVAIILMLVMSVSVHPVLAAPADTKNNGVPYLAGSDTVPEITDPASILDLPQVRSNQIRTITVDEIGLRAGDSENLKSVSSADGRVTITVLDPLTTHQRSDSSASLAGTGDVQLDAAISALVQEGYTLTGRSDHRYKTRVTADRPLQTLDTSTVAVSGSDPTTVTVVEDVTSYIFVNTTARTHRVVSVIQAVDTAGNTVGDRQLTVSPVRADATSDSGPEQDMIATGWFIPLPGFLEIGAIISLILALILSSTPDSNIVVFDHVIYWGNPMQVDLRYFEVATLPGYTDYTRLGSGGGAAIRRNGEVQVVSRIRGMNRNRNSPPQLAGNDWVQVTNGAAIKKNGTLVTWSEGKIPTPVIAPGKKYVAVSQLSDWLLAIYQDDTGQTHLETLGNCADHADVCNHIPTGTNWSAVAAGTNHALALRTDGTLVAWGNNADGQLDLPAAGRCYSMIAAGDRFSLGLTANNATDKNTILAAGFNGDWVVNTTPTVPDNYLKITAGRNSAAALTHDGHIVLWGRIKKIDENSDSPVHAPSDGGFTDIAINDANVDIPTPIPLDDGFWPVGLAITESAHELQPSGPISLNSLPKSIKGINDVIPYGATIDHPDQFVTKVIRPDGTVMFWVNDKASTPIRFPTGAVLPSTRVHYIPSAMVVNAKSDYKATVSLPATDPNNNDGEYATDNTLLTVTESAWFDDQNPAIPKTIPRAFCFADIGCSAGVTAKQHLLLSPPLSPGDSSAPGEPPGIPTFSVHQLSNSAWIGTLTIPNSPAPQDATAIIMEKNNVNPNQPVNLSIISSNWGADPGTNIVLSAQANLTTTRPGGLQYSVTGTSSIAIPEINIAPKIWLKKVTGDVLVYTGKPVKCPDTSACSATGLFTPISNATYFANATILYTVPAGTTNGAAGTQQYAVMVASGVVTAAGSTKQSTNVEGRSAVGNTDLYKSIIQYAAGNQSGYSGDYYFQPSNSTINTRIPKDYIFFFNGHGEPGAIGLKESGDWYCAKGCDKGWNLDELASNSYLTFVHTLACETGLTDSTRGNFIDKIYDKGAKCAIGYSSSINSWTALVTYSQKFWDKIKDGKTINYADSSGIDAAKALTICKEGGFDDKACNLTHEYKKDDGTCAGSLDAYIANRSNVQTLDSHNQLSLERLNSERESIKVFEQKPTLNLTYVESDTYPYGVLDEFDSDIGFFKVNKQTNRVQSAVIIENVPRNSVEQINLAQGQAIAEKYAKEKYPTLWETSATTTGVTLKTNRINDMGSDKEFQYVWNEVLYSPNNTVKNYKEIEGLNSVMITVSPYTGHIKNYHEWNIPLDSNLNLLPSLSEDQAWVFAKAHYATQGVHVVLPNEVTHNGLSIAIDSNNQQHLTWRFGVTRRINGILSGGVVLIDSHSGGVVDFAEII